MSISLVLIYRRVTPAINKLFDSVIGQIDEYILVNTGPDDADGSQALVEAAVEPGVPTVHLEYRCPREWELEGTKYIGDFAAARTYAHRHATGTWHLSLDSDDELRGASLQDCLVAAVQEDPHVNCISMPYFYQDTRIVHDRPRLWRADLAWTWRYELHEIRVPAGGGRVVVYPTDRCEVVHHGDPEASERRNTAMVAWLMEQPDPSDHVRLARAAATAKQGFYATACRLAKQLWKENPKGDLNYRAGLVAAQACYDSGNRIRARALLGGLIATQPENRIAYLDLAAFLVDQGELREAARLFKQAFLELPQNQSYEFMTTPHWVDIELRSRAVEVLATVGNYEAAREIYQRGPASAARLEEAHAFLEQEEGLAKVARAIDTVTHYFLDTGFIERAEKLVDDLVTEELAPRVAEIRKQVHECGLQYEKVSASACEKLAQVLAGTTGYAVPPSRSVHDVLSGGECVETSPGGWRVVRSRSQRRVPLHVVAPGPLLWGPQAHQRRGIGGSEQAVINLVPFWADQYDVHVWASRLEEETFHRGVAWHHADRFDPTRQNGPVIVWRDHTKLPECSGWGNKVVFWAHDIAHAAHRYYYDHADIIWVLSEYHKQLFCDVGVAADKLVVLRNGIDPAAITAARTAWHPGHAIYGSAASRGLLLLLDMWPAIRERVPEAVLHVCYGLELLDHPGLPQYLRGLKQVVELRLDQAGVEYHGAQPHPEFLKTAAACQAWLYPTIFEEISCIVAMEMQALGLNCVTTNRAALAETVIEPQMDWNILVRECGLLPTAVERGEVRFGGSSQTFIDRAVGALTAPTRDPVPDWETRFSWGGIAEEYLKCLT